MALIELSRNALVVTVNSDAGGRIASLEHNETELLVTSARGTYDWGLYPMVPYAGRVRDAVFVFDGVTYSLPPVANGHALHGTVLHRSWTVSDATADSVTLHTDFGSDWPFEGTCTHTISLLADRVRCVLSVHAHDSMPVQLGWHPWFRTPRSAVTDFNTMLQRGDDGIPTGEHVPTPTGDVDDCFIEPNAWPRVTVEETTVEVASDCPYWVRFDAPFGDVCIEPQSGPPNGINDVPYVLNAGETFSRWMELRVVSD